MILDKGLVIDASIPTWVRGGDYPLDLWDKGGRSLPDLVTEEARQAVESVASSVVYRTVDDALDSVGGPSRRASGECHPRRCSEGRCVVEEVGHNLLQK